MPPLVSIITATCDHEDFIADCIDSVRRQTFTDWEMVVLDDDSHDRTAEIAQSFARSDSRIRVLAAQSRRGLHRLGETYAIGLDATSAPLVAVLEGDDAWPADKLLTQLPHFDDPGVVFSYGAAMLLDEFGCRYARYKSKPARAAVAHNDPPGAILPALAFHNFIVSSTVIVRRDALTRIGGFWQPEGVPYVDHPTWLRLALEGRFAWTDTIVGYWRRHARQWTTSSTVTGQPDRRMYIREVLAEARAAGTSPYIPDAVVEADLDRMTVWTEISRLRLALIDGSLPEAGTAAWKLLRSGRLVPAGLAVMGLLAGVLGGDLEWLFRLLQRYSWPSRRHRREHRSH